MQGSEWKGRKNLESVREGLAGVWKGERNKMFETAGKDNKEHGDCWKERKIQICLKECRRDQWAGEWKGE